MAAPTRDGIYHATPLVQALGGNPVLMRLEAKRAESAAAAAKTQTVTAAAAPVLAATAPAAQAAPVNTYFRILPMNTKVSLDENTLRTGTLSQVLNEINPLKFVIGALVLQVKEYMELIQDLGNSFDLDALIGEVNNLFIKLEINKHFLTCQRILSTRVNQIRDSLQTRNLLIKEIESRWTLGIKEIHGIDYHQTYLTKLISQLVPKASTSLLSWIPGAAYAASVAVSWYYPETPAAIPEKEVSLFPETKYTHDLGQHLEGMAALREDMLITYSVTATQNQDNPATYQLYKKKYDDLEKAELLLREAKAPLVQLKLNSNAAESTEYQRKSAANEVASIEARWLAIDKYKQEIVLALHAQRSKIKMTDELLKNVEIRELHPNISEGNDYLKQLIGLGECIKTDKRNNTKDQAELQAFYKYYNGKFTELNAKINEQKLKKDRMIDGLKKENVKEETLYKFIIHQLYSFDKPLKVINEGLQARDKWLESVNKSKLDKKDGKLDN